MTLPKLILAGTLLALASCTKAPEAPPAMPPPMVQIAAPEVRKVSDWDEFTGRTEAVESVEVRPRVSGHLQSVNFRSGQTVKKGDLLFQIDPRWHEAEMKRAVAAVELARSRLTSAEAEAKRADELARTRAISTEDAESRRNALAGARAGLQAAEAARDAATLDFEFTSVRAPIDGRISRALVTEGNHVSGVPGFTTMLTTIVSENPVYVYAAVDETNFVKYSRLIAEKKLGNPQSAKVPAEVKITGDTEWKRRGWIESFDNRISAGSGSVVMRVLLDNADGSVPVGSFARVRVPAGPDYDAVLVDEKLIGTDQSVKYVLTMAAGNLASVSPVKLGKTIDGKRVITEGLKPEDKLIISNTQFVIPGMPVVPLPDAPAKVAAN